MKLTGTVAAEATHRQTASGAAALFMAVDLVILLTWAVMPDLVRKLKPWLGKNS